MRNFFLRLQNGFARFMYGRNGTDQLNAALLIVYLVLFVLTSILTAVFQNQILYLITQLLLTFTAVVLIWRTFSKNLTKRRAENAKFLNWWYPIQSRLRGAKARLQDKDHKYFTCKHCRTVCRVPAGKGKIEITCPKCGAKILGKS